MATTRIMSLHIGKGRIESQPGRLLPGLPEAYHPQTDRRAYEENAGECDATEAK